MKYLYKYTPEIILLIFLFLFLGFRDVDRNWDRVINSDGKGYYAYLPAMFIYHDWQFNFLDQYENQYYPPDRSVYKEFRNAAGERKVNKYFPGLAIVFLPFFLFGHLLAYIELYPMDGYSLPYQYSIALAALFFLWMGARWLMKVLKLFGSNDRTAAFITLVVTLGTNLVFFSIVEASMTHVYSFALITAYIYTSFRLFHDYKPKWFIRTLLLYLLIFLIRPTNGLILLLLPFIAGSWQLFSSTLRKVAGEKPTLLKAFIPALLLVSLPFILWRIQTGHWIVYSYGEEKLNFFRPHMFSILFSYNRGWFMYTPIAFISLFGLVGLFQKSRFRFYWLCGFILVFIYAVSCWWVWDYASKCGQRIFIDIYAITALLMLFLYESIRSGLLKKLLSTLLILMVGLNLLQFYQHTRWIFPPSVISGEIFWDSFFSLHQKANVYLPGEGIIQEKSFQNDMEKADGWMNTVTRNDTVFHEGEWSSKIDKRIPYSVGLEQRLDSLFITDNRIIRVEAWVMAPIEITEATLVMDFQKDGKSLSYNQFILEKYARVNQWTRIEVAYYVPRNLPSGGFAKIYFFNPSKFYPLYIDDLKIDFISMKDEPDYQKTEGIHMPEKLRNN